MPDLFARPHFNSKINLTITNVNRIVSTEPSDFNELLDLLLPLEAELIKHYQTQHAPAEAHRLGQKTYRQYIQYALCLALTHNKTEQHCETLLTFSLCAPLFYFESRPGIYESSLWLDQDNQPALLTLLEKRAFRTLSSSLLKEAEQALQKVMPNEHTDSLRRFLVLFDFKAMLLKQLQVALAPHWQKYEKHLIEQVINFFPQFLEAQYQRASERLISNTDNLVLHPQEIERLVEWVEFLRQEVIKVIETQQDPITYTHLLDKESESAEAGEALNLRNLADPLCFLPDEQPYFLSTFKNLYAHSDGGGVFQSPISKQTIAAHAYESTSLEALVALTRGIINLKEHILLTNSINIKKAIMLLLGDNEFRAREFAARERSTLASEPNAQGEGPRSALFSSRRGASLFAEHHEDNGVPPPAPIPSAPPAELVRQPMGAAASFLPLPNIERQSHQDQRRRGRLYAEGDSYPHHEESHPRAQLPVIPVRNQVQEDTRSSDYRAYRRELLYADANSQASSDEQSTRMPGPPRNWPSPSEVNVTSRPWHETSTPAFFPPQQTQVRAGRRPAGQFDLEGGVQSHTPDFFSPRRAQDRAGRRPAEQPHYNDEASRHRNTYQ
ncbi:hypothetical protein [Legionella sp. km772]|uniref:hypothetical protein n=1 Tax=Legionella sp. km772 TaxID=2498111 RepID=UPI000F8DE051|nr:hypothetical protein [Legionella sp. km772]RUR09985.1 hypothetical protein ELY15_08660 [Legionella sp. km772]